MPNEAMITEIENILSEVVKLGGENERTQIVPNLTVQDANPTGLDGFVIVSDNRDGDNILAKKLGSVIYADNDLVNVMFVEGAEAVAFQQGSQSVNPGDIWEIVPDTTTDIFYDRGRVGIGTDEIPHESVGAALLALNGPNANFTTGPHIQITTDTDNYPLVQLLAYGHDDIYLQFDAYSDSGIGNSISADGGSNFAIAKTTNQLVFLYDGLVPAGNAITWNDGIVMNRDGEVGIGDSSPDSLLVVAGESFIGPVAASGNTSNSDMTIGLTINQDANDDEIFALKSSDVAHGVTSLLETDTYCAMQKANGSAGGVQISGATELESGILLQSLYTNDDSSKSTSSVAPIFITARKKVGTTVGNPSANANLVVIRGGITDTKWIIDQDGDTWQQGSITLGTDVIHEGDTDTKISFTDDKISFDAGSLNMLSLTETAQDLVEIGDVAGGGDVDVNFNNGQVFIEGSSGFLGIGVTSPEVETHIASGSAGVDLAWVANVDVALFESATNVNTQYFTPNTGVGAIGFSDPDARNVGGITYAHATDLMTIAASGAGVLFIDSTGLGIGTTPSHKLHVKNTSAGSDAIAATFHNDSTTSGTGTSLDFIANTSETLATGRIVNRREGSGDHSLSLGTFGNFTTIVTRNGLVGLNAVTAPSTELDIGAGAMEFEEMTAPGGGAANTARLYAVDNGAGKTQLAVIFNTGAAQILATQP